MSGLVSVLTMGVSKLLYLAMGVFGLVQQLTVGVSGVVSLLTVGM